MTSPSFRIALVVACLVAIVSSATADEVRMCYPLATVKISFKVVFPKAKQVIMAGDEARDYLRIYNEYGRPTNFQGDALLLNIMPDGTTLFVPFEGNVGCKRVVVGPKLHRIIMQRMKKGRI